MLLEEYDNEIIRLPIQPTKIITKINDELVCYDKDSKDINVDVVEIIDYLTFRIKELDTKYTDDKIFISGTEIDDVHTISKEHIFTLNVCATQELHRRMEAQNVIIKSQEARIKELETKMEQILKYISI